MYKLYTVGVYILNYIVRVKNTDQAYTKLMKLKFI